MRICGTFWYGVMLSVVAGCSSTTAEPVEGRATASQPPEWVRADTDEPTVVVAGKIQPIPDETDDTSVPAAPSVMPFPNEDGQ